MSRKKKDKDKKPRKMNPKSLANLAPPVKPGEVLNPTGINRKRPITDEYYARSQEPLPEPLRLKINAALGVEVLKPKATWAEANSLRRFLDALTEGGHPSSKEIRESIEGKAPERLEIMGTQKKEITIRVSFDRTRR
jgi:hypothetical protein